MKILAPVFLILCLSAGAFAQAPAKAPESPAGFLDTLKAAIARHLGRPYVWGASGMKSFDCSGFIWRVMFENGIPMKRTTARKFYMLLPPAEKSGQGEFGTIVFFDNLKHVGIVNSPKDFYHAQTSLGTNLSKFDPYWRKKIYGYRKLPAPPPN